MTAPALPPLTTEVVETIRAAFKAGACPFPQSYTMIGQLLAYIDVQNIELDARAKIVAGLTAEVEALRAQIAGTGDEIETPANPSGGAEEIGS